MWSEFELCEVGDFVEVEERFTEDRVDLDAELVFGLAELLWAGFNSVDDEESAIFVPDSIGGCIDCFMTRCFLELVDFVL